MVRGVHTQRTLVLSAISPSQVGKGAQCPSKLFYRPQRRNRHPVHKFLVSPAASTTRGQAATAKDVAEAYYECYNTKNIKGVLDLIADDCVYEDLVYQEPFRGKEEIKAYFDKLEEWLPKDIRFVVEDITEGDQRKVGVRWHVEIGDGIAFPFSRGASFYEINEQGKIVFARDLVEPTIKPGSSAMKAISVLAPVIRKLGPAADPSNLSKLPIAAGGMLALYLSYLFYVLLSTSAPGLPAWQTSPEVIQELIHESYNFFYINIGLAQFGLNPVPSIAAPPVAEGLFNFMNAWSIMLWPAMLADPRGKNVENKFPIWLGTFFLTNVFFPSYMVLRLLPPKDSTALETAPTRPKPSSCEPPVLPGYAASLGAVCGIIGFISMFWALGARPELGGDLADRIAYISDHFAHDRVFWAFCLDAVLYSVWQNVLLTAANACPLHRNLPFFGMVLWLLKSNSEKDVYVE